MKEPGFGPDLGERFFSDVAGRQFQVAAGLDNAAIGDKGKSLAAQAALGHGLHAVGRRGNLLARGRGILPPEAIKLRRARGFNVQPAFLLAGQEPAQGFFGTP